MNFPEELSDSAYFRINILYFRYLKKTEAIFSRRTIRYYICDNSLFIPRPAAEKELLKRHDPERKNSIRQFIPAQPCLRYSAPHTDTGSGGR